MEAVRGTLSIAFIDDIHMLHMYVSILKIPPDLNQELN